MYCPQSFTKQERLSDKKKIEELFETGKVFNLSPYKVIYLFDQSGQCPLRMLIAVPGKTYRKAVQRNRIRRITREAYRKNKLNLLNTIKARGNSLSMILIYTDKTILSYKEIEQKIILILQRLLSENEQSVQ